MAPAMPLSGASWQPWPRERTWRSGRIERSGLRAPRAFVRASPCGAGPLGGSREKTSRGREGDALEVLLGF